MEKIHLGTCLLLDLSAEETALELIYNITCSFHVLLEFISTKEKAHTAHVTENNSIYACAE